MNMSEAAKHSEGEARVDDNQIFIGGDLAAVAVFDNISAAECDANAAELARRWNLHEKLLAACKAARRVLLRGDLLIPDDFQDEIENARAKLTFAVQAAENEAEAK
jgi:hypothetical protein